MLTRGAEASAAGTDFVAFGVAGALGCAVGGGAGTLSPCSTLVLGGLAVGKNLPDAQVQPSSTSTLSSTARIRFLLSFNSQSLTVPGRGPDRPKDDSGRCA